jgi:hypothetical protein
VNSRLGEYIVREVKLPGGTVDLIGRGTRWRPFLAKSPFLEKPQWHSLWREATRGGSVADGATMLALVTWELGGAERARGGLE